MFPRVCQCDLSYQTKCTKRTGIIRLVGCRQSCKSFFISLLNLFLLSILFRETIKVGEIITVRAVARVHCYRVRHLLHEHIRTCHAQQPPPLEFLFRYTDSGMLFFIEAIYLSNVCASVLICASRTCREFVRFFSIYFIHASPHLPFLSIQSYLLSTFE